MRKVIMTLSAVVFTIAIHAQDNKVTQPASTNAQEAVINSNDYFVMKGGKIYYFKNNKATTFDKDMTLSNGTTISPSGDIKEKSGSVKKMKEGDFLYTNGTFRSTMKSTKAE